MKFKLERTYSVSPARKVDGDWEFYVPGYSYTGEVLREDYDVDHYEVVEFEKGLDGGNFGVAFLTNEKEDEWYVITVESLDELFDAFHASDKERKQLLKDLL